MGNCIKKQTAIQRDGGVWGSTAAAAPGTMYLSGSDRGDSRKGESYSGGSFGDKTATTEVKIKISKKQLEELLGRTDVQGLTVEQILAKLMNVSDGFESNQRPWRPALQSIPE
ncbi:uncharacterized protein LOC111912689 [Lactuca sativa]|uniref:uncharacterized protein LOC111912689 n=1 Tax=Lactuca sativa TaxID=4236 RepID=UPI000CBF7B58|nr:uncharacterized protein LOC111912689 [Lactuca sativa]